MDYLEALSRNRESGTEHAATAEKTLDGVRVVRAKRPRTAAQQHAVKKMQAGAKRRRRMMSRPDVTAWGRRMKPGQLAADRAPRLTKGHKRALLTESGTATSQGKGSAGAKNSLRRSKMAKKRRTAKQKAATAKMIRAAKRARAAKKAPRRRKARRAKSNPTKARRTARRAARRRKKSHASEWHGEPQRHAKAARKGWRRRKARKAHAAPKRRRAKRSSAPRRKRGRKARRTAKQLRAARRNIKKAQAAVRGRRASQGHRSRSSKRSAYAAERRPRRRGRGRRRGAMENPMTGVELFVGSIFGLVGFGAADALDRVLATHALTDKGTKDANGHELYADNPATTGSYAGLFNATAICAPMDVTRWLAGLATAGFPLLVAHFVGGPVVRSSLQFFGFGAGVRIVGKGLTDLVAMVTKTTPIGQRLYDGEMRAAALKSGGSANPELASLPSAGLGNKAPKTLAGPDCAPCADKTKGAGYPSMPREVAAPAAGAQQPTTVVAPPPPPPPPPAAVPPSNNGVTLRGIPVARRAPGANWGAHDDN